MQNTIFYKITMFNRQTNNNFNISLILTMGLILTFCILSQLLLKCRYGLDLTDESFYLIWITYPWNYLSSLSQFGFLYHPLSLLIHGDITLLRQCNVIFIFSLAWILFIIFFNIMLRQITQTKNSKTYLPFIALGAIFATSSFTYFCTFPWLLTPSYNSLILQALLIASIGVLLAEKQISRNSIIGWLLIGLAGYFTFMAKPPSAGILAVAIFSYLCIANKLNLRMLFLAILTSIVCLSLSAWLIDGSIYTFINRYYIALNDFKLLQSSLPLIRWDTILLTTNEKIAFFNLFLLFSLITYFITTLKIWIKQLSLIFLFFILMIGFTIFINDFSLQKLTQYNFLIFQILTIPLSMLAVAIALKKFSAFSLTRSQWALGLFFIVLPYCFAFGTSNNYWMQSQQAMIFWVLGGLVFLIPCIIQQTKSHVSWNILLPTAIGIEIFSLFFIQLAMDFPYRQPPKVQNYNEKIIIGINQSQQILSHPIAHYLQTAKRLAAQSGFKSQTPMIDLTGQSPGILYTIGAKSIGQAWMLGGYPGSNAYATALLNLVSCQEIANAWLLYEPESKQQISPEILNHFGINFSTDYINVAEFNTPFDPETTWSTARNHKQQLLKPIRPMNIAIAACENTKALNRDRHDTAR